MLPPILFNTTECGDNATTSTTVVHRISYYEKRIKGEGVLMRDVSKQHTAN